MVVATGWERESHVCWLAEKETHRLAAVRQCLPNPHPQTQTPSIRPSITARHTAPTCVTPSTWKSFLARGEAMASRALVKLLLPPVSSTGWPGMNMRLAGLGVGCVWMNMPRRCCCCWAADGQGRARQGGSVQVGNSHKQAAAVCSCTYARRFAVADPGALPASAHSCQKLQEALTKVGCCRLAQRQAVQAGRRRRRHGRHHRRASPVRQLQGHMPGRWHRHSGAPHMAAGHRRRAVQRGLLTTDSVRAQPAEPPSAAAVLSSCCSACRRILSPYCSSSAKG